MKATETPPHKDMRLVKSLRVWFRHREAMITWSSPINPWFIFCRVPLTEYLTMKVGFSAHPWVERYVWGIKKQSPHSPRPFSPQRAWRLAYCWAAAWSARCWSWSQVGTSPGPWGACAGGGSPGSPPVSAAWPAWCSLGPGSPARGWCDESTPAAGRSNDKKPWIENCAQTAGVALIS